MTERCHGTGVIPPDGDEGTTRYACTGCEDCQCPTCGSDNPAVRLTKWVETPGGWSHGPGMRPAGECDDPFHSSAPDHSGGSNPVGETPNRDAEVKTAPTSSVAAPEPGRERSGDLAEGQGERCPCGNPWEQVIGECDEARAEADRLRQERQEARELYESEQAEAIGYSWEASEREAQVERLRQDRDKQKRLRDGWHKAWRRQKRRAERAERERDEARKIAADFRSANNRLWSEDSALFAEVDREREAVESALTRLLEQVKQHRRIENPDGTAVPQDADLYQLADEIERTRGGGSDADSRSTSGQEEASHVTGGDGVEMKATKRTDPSNESDGAEAFEGDAVAPSHYQTPGEAQGRSTGFGLDDAVSRPGDFRGVSGDAVAPEPCVTMDCEGMAVATVPVYDGESDVPTQARYCSGCARTVAGECDDEIEWDAVVDMERDLREASIHDRDAVAPSENQTEAVARLELTEDEAAELWWALYLTYGNETGLWAGFRAAVGEDRFGAVADAGQRLGTARSLDRDAVAPEAIRRLEFRPERSRPIWRNKHTGSTLTVLDLVVNDEGGFHGGCRQFFVVAVVPGPPGPAGPLGGPRGHPLWVFLRNWEPTGEYVPADRVNERSETDDDDD